eukprot:403364548
MQLKRGVRFIGYFDIFCLLITAVSLVMTLAGIKNALMPVKQFYYFLLIRLFCVDFLRVTCFILLVKFLDSKNTRLMMLAIRAITIPVEAILAIVTFTRLRDYVSESGYTISLAWNIALLFFKWVLIVLNAYFGFMIFKYYKITDREQIQIELERLQQEQIYVVHDKNLRNNQYIIEEPNFHTGGQMWAPDNDLRDRDQELELEDNYEQEDHDKFDVRRHINFGHQQPNRDTRTTAVDLNDYESDKDKKSRSSIQLDDVNLDGKNSNMLDIDQNQRQKAFQEDVETITFHPPEPRLSTSGGKMRVSQKFKKQKYSNNQNNNSDDKINPEEIRLDEEYIAKNDNTPFNSGNDKNDQNPLTTKGTQKDNKILISLDDEDDNQLVKSDYDF